ncbi:hypothetical protein ACFX2J_014685 [Malus domestica]
METLIKPLQLAALMADSQAGPITSKMENGMAKPKAQSSMGKHAGNVRTDAKLTVGPISTRTDCINHIGMPSPLGDSVLEKSWDPDNMGQQLSLLNLISSQEQSDDPSKIGTAFTAFINQDSGWIIDYGATDHMTYDESLFHYLTESTK